MAKRKARPRGKRLTDHQRELVVQAYALTGNKAQVGRDLNLSQPTILKILRDAETDKELQAARARALDDMAGRVHHKTGEILESITPGDLESGRQLFYDTDGRVTRKVEWGPSLLQKVTAAAILTDKTKIIEETKRALIQDTGGDDAGLPLPRDMQSALRLLGTKIKRIRALDIQFDDKQPELSQKLQDTVAAAEIHPHIDEADYSEIALEDFDNQSGDAGES